MTNIQSELRIRAHVMDGLGDEPTAGLLLLAADTIDALHTRVHQLNEHAMELQSELGTVRGNLATAMRDIAYLDNLHLPSNRSGGES